MLLAAAAASWLVATTVQAQSECGAPDLSGRNQIWSATLTVGAPVAGELRGFEDGMFGYGGLSDKTFTIGARSYQINLLTVSTAQGVSDLAQFGLTSALAAGDRGRLMLHVCARSFSLSAAELTPIGNVYFWTGSGVRLPSETTATVRLSTPSPTAATGAPAISGTAEVARTLTASIGTVADDDGLPGSEGFEWQWIRVGADGSSHPVRIADATGTTYLVDEADVGSKLRVEFRFVDNNANQEARTSEAVPQNGTVVRSSDATLTGLVVSNAANDSALGLEPAFAAAVTSYAVETATGVESVTVVATPTRAMATIRYLDGSDHALEDADAMKEGQQVAVSEGSNTVKVEVTAENATTTTTYTVTVRVAEPPFTGALVDNTGETAVAVSPVPAYMQGFTTGVHTRGFEFGTVVLRMENVPGARVEIWSSNPAGYPAARQWRLTRGADANTFDAPKGAKLEPDRTYFVHVQTGTTGANARVGMTPSDNEVGRSDWQIENTRREGGGAWWPASGDGRSLRLRVTGSTLSELVVPAPEPDAGDVDWKPRSRSGTGTRSTGSANADGASRTATRQGAKPRTRKTGASTTSATGGSPIATSRSAQRPTT